VLRPCEVALGRDLLIQYCDSPVTAAAWNGLGAVGLVMTQASGRNRRGLNDAGIVGREANVTTNRRRSARANSFVFVSGGLCCTCAHAESATTNASAVGNNSQREPKLPWSVLCRCSEVSITSQSVLLVPVRCTRNRTYSGDCLAWSPRQLRMCCSRFGKEAAFSSRGSDAETMKPGRECHARAGSALVALKAKHARASRVAQSSSATGRSRPAD
jgi:hypothetical protein